MEELEAVYYVTSSFEGNEEVVSTDYVVGQTTDCTESNINDVSKEVYSENNNCKETQVYVSQETETTPGDRVIIMDEDGRVVIVDKKGNEENIITGSYVEGDMIETGEIEERQNVNESQDILIQNNDCDIKNNVKLKGKRCLIKKFTCKYCSDKFTSIRTLYAHLKKVHNSDERIELSEDNQLVENIDSSNSYVQENQPSTSSLMIKSDSQTKRQIKIVRGIEPKVKKVTADGVEVDKLTCEFCLKTFTKTSNKQRHIRIIHQKKRPIGNDIKCVECDLCFKHINGLREHLQFKHKLDMSDQKLSFPNMSAFKKWKCEIERKTLSSYTLRHGSRKTSKGPKLFYMCHRSGRYSPKMKDKKTRKRMLRVGGTCKMGIMCTAAIYCQECANEVEVRYIPHHYGHGQETSFVQLSPAEQAAIQESVSSGIPFEDLVDDIRENQFKDTFQLFLLKKRDLRWINSAFNAEEYNPGISDAESVENWVKRCCQMEDSPVLFYQQQNIGCEQEEFMLVIMTEFQKHILLSSQRTVACVDSLYRRKGGRFYLTVLFVMDEFENAFPAAFCISNKVDKNVIEQFLLSVKESTGNLCVKYFMSDNESTLYEAWVNVMEDKPRWLWSIWYVDSKIRTQLKCFKGNTSRRAEVYKTMRTLLECQNESVFTCMFKNFIEDLHSDTTTKNLGDFIMSKYGSNAEMWASCYRKEVNLSTNMHLEVMHRTFRYCCREGRKNRLDKFLFVVMKLIKCKMLDRISDMLDSDKLSLAIEAINSCHSSGLEVPAENMSALSERIWLVSSEEDEDPFYVTKELDKCPEHCSLRCEECDICVHQYSCSCVQSMIDANLCKHIHAVVWKFLTPHFSPAASPSYTMGPDDDFEIEPDTSVDVYFGSVLKKTHEVYRKIKANKCSLNREALDSLMKRLNECVDVCAGKKVDEPPKKPEPAPPPSNVAYVVNPNFKNTSRPFILPNISQATVMNKVTVPQYVMILPNNNKIPKLLKP